MPLEGRVDGSELKRLASDLRKVAPEIRKQLPKRLREAAAPIVDDAKGLARNASPRGRIKVSTRSKLASRNGASVKIVGRSPADPPLAGLMERGSHGNPNEIRHPTYGRKDHNGWQTMPTRPYIQPAVDSHRDEVVGHIADIVDDIKRVLRS